MMKKFMNIFLAMLLIQSLFGVEAKAQEHLNGNAADVVILVDFSGSITEDPRYPEAEKSTTELNKCFMATWFKYCNTCFRGS